MTTNSMTLVSATCTMCDDSYAIEIPTDDLMAWKQGEFVQNAFHYLTPAEREFFFQSHICGICWNRMFADMDDDE